MKTLKNLALVLGIFMFAVPAFAQVADDYGTANSGNYCPKLSITMQRGARDISYSGQVSELQKFLSDHYDIDPEEIVTGFFGRITQGYVQQFQREQELPSFGIAGSMTRDAIAKVCSLNTFNHQTSAISGTSSSLSCSTFSDITYGMFDTDPGGRVSQLQAWLGIPSNTFGFGTYGPKTRAIWNSRCGGTQTTNISTTPIPNQEATEQVKCVFSGATTEQKCYGYAPSPIVGSDPVYYSCTGIGTCVVTVNGKQNTPVTWGSSCGGSADTKIDSNNEYANFNCPTTTQPSAASTFSVDLKINGSDGPITVSKGSDVLLTWSATEPSQCAVTISRLYNVNWYDNDLENPNKTGSHQTGPINESMKYTISCVDASSTVRREDSIVINVDEKKSDEATEQVKCVFNGATTEQKCYGYAPSPTVGSNPIYYSCTGVGTCVVTVTGKQNTPVTWGSSCGGSANTTIDNNNEYANFTCPTTIQPSITVTYPNGWEGFTLGKTIPITWKTSQPGVGSVSIYLRDEDNGKEFVLEDSAPNTGSYDAKTDAISVPGIVADRAYRISMWWDMTTNYAQNRNANDVSDMYFKIYSSTNQ